MRIQKILNFNFIENFIKNNNIENRVIMMGYREDIELILPNFDIFVLPSKEEALGTSLLEAQSAGVCALGSRVGGIPECIKENHTGLLFEPLNPQDLKEKLQTLVNNKNLREQFNALNIDFINNILKNNNLPPIKADFSDILENFYEL